MIQLGFMLVIHIDGPTILATDLSVSPPWPPLYVPAQWNRKKKTHALGICVGSLRNIDLHHDDFRVVSYEWWVMSGEDEWWDVSVERWQWRWRWRWPLGCAFGYSNAKRPQFKTSAIVVPYFVFYVLCSIFYMSTPWGASKLVSLAVELACNSKVIML